MLATHDRDFTKVEIAGVTFEASGSGDVLTGVAGPQPAKDSPSPRLPLEGLTHAGLPLHRWSDHPDGDEAPIFVLDEPIIYVGTSRDGLHSVTVTTRTLTTSTTIHPDLSSIEVCFCFWGLLVRRPFMV